MKKICTIVFAIIVSLGAAYGRGADTLKVMTYNLRFGELASMEEIGEFIKSENPDIVALQECDWDTHRERAPRQNGVKFVNRLADVTGLFGLYGKSIDYGGGYYGIGLLSKYPIVRSERIKLPRNDSSEQRVMLRADIELPDGNIVTFVSTHLEVTTKENRMIQVKFIEKQLRKVKNPVLLAGDMNATPDSPEMAELSKHWKNLTDGTLTFSSKKPTVKIDYIYGKPADKMDLLETEVPHEVKLSDHFPVISLITIN